MYAANSGDGNAGSFNNNSASRVALAGVNASTDSGAIGVYGNVANGAGVYGITAAGIGVEGYSTSNTAVYGGTVNGHGVAGVSTNSLGGYFRTDNAGSAALLAVNTATGSVTSLFSVIQAKGSGGTCGIGDNGDLNCTGQIKSLASADGGARRVETYAVQSPESWMEDFGSAEIKGGVAVVTIDPGFAETISALANYHIFLTPNGDSKGLYVIRKTSSSFEVREAGGGTSTLSFDYRIVAKRRGFEQQRLVDATERFAAETRPVPTPSVKAAAFRP